MSVVEEITNLTDILIDAAATTNLGGLTVIDMRLLSEELINQGVSVKDKIIKDTCDQLKNTLIDRAAKYSNGNKYLSEYNMGYLEALSDIETYIDVLSQKRGV